MRHFSKILSLVLVVLICLTVICVGSYSAFADTSFDDGDYRFTLTSDSTVMVSKYYGSETELTLPDFVGDRLVTGIYQSCFENSNVTTIVIPRAYTTIGDFAFNGCSSLETVKIPSGLKSIGIMAFYGCESLKNIDLQTAENLSAISFAAFSGCSSLEKVIIPDTVNSIGENAFVDCVSLSDLTLSDSLINIPEYAFYNCALGSVELPQNLQKIGKCAFYNNINLKSVFIPESVTSIGSDAFAPMSESGDIDIVVYKGSYAEEYGIENELDRLVIIDSYIGDANSDGIVSISDVTAIQQYLVGIIDDSVIDLSAADVDGDGVLTIYDATYIQRFIARLNDPCYINRSKAASS